MSGKLSIKEEMRAIDTRARGWYESLTEEEKAKFDKQMWIQMRYCSAVESKVSDINEHYLIMTNELVNVHFNVLRHHPQLQHKLLQLVGIGKSQYHPWIAPGKGGNNKVSKLEKWLLEIYPHLNDDELELMLAINTEDDFKDMMLEAGLDDKQIKEIFSKKKKK